MNTDQLFQRMNNINERYLQAAQDSLAADPAAAPAARRRHAVPRRLVALAAVLCLLLALSVTAVAANWFGLRDLLLPQQHEVQVPFDPERPDQDPQTYLADIISLTGYSDTPEARATAEWQAFLNSYDQDKAIIQAIGNKPTGFEEEYGLYQVYTQEMADKLDEIAAKYGLKLHTSLLLIGLNEEVESHVGCDFLGENRAYSAYMYEDGTFKFDGEIDLADYGHLDYQFHRCVRGSFTDMILNIVDINDYAEWVCTTESGVPVTLALAPRKALIIANLPDSFVTINVLAGTETPADDIFSHGPFDAEDLERFADSFDFSALTPVQPVSPEQLELGEQQEAELEADSRFWTITGLEQWQAQEFFAKFADSIEQGDRQTVAEMLYYPATVTWWNTTTAGTHQVYEVVERPEEFLPFYDKIFTDNLWWNCISANRYDKERFDLIPDNGMVGAAGGSIWFMPAEEGIRVVTVQNNEGNSVRMTEPAETDVPRYDSAQTAYTSILSSLLQEHILPDGMLYEPFDGGPADQFALLDLTGDGAEELLLLAANTYTAGQVGYVLSWDEATGTVRTLLCEYPSLTFYENGYVQAWASHNQGVAGDALWPYTLYRYDSSAGIYRAVNMVDAWDRSLTENYYGMSFPANADRSGTGVVYYVMGPNNYELSDPMDAADYQAWIDAQIGNTSQLQIIYQSLTEESIRQLKVS